MLLDELGRRVDAAEHLEDTETIERPVYVPNGLQDLRRTLARRGVPLFRRHSGTQFALQRAHVSGRHQLVSRPDAQVQISRGCFLELEPEALRFLLRTHPVT